MSDTNSTPSRKNTDDTLVGSPTGKRRSLIPSPIRALFTKRPTANGEVTAQREASAVEITQHTSNPPPRRASTTKTLVETPGDKDQITKDSPTQYYVSDTVFVASPTSPSGPSLVLSPTAAGSASCSPASKPDTSSSPDAINSPKLQRPSTTKQDSSCGEYENMRSAALAIAQTSLSFAEAFNIPYLKGVVALVLLILEYADGVAANKEDCFRIVNNVTRLLAVLDEKAKNISHSASKNLERQADQLKTSLERVCMDVKKLSDSKRHYLKKLVLQERDKEIIKRCDNELDQAHKIFSLQSSLEVQTGVADIQTQMGHFFGSIEDRLETIENTLAGTRSSESSQEAGSLDIISTRINESLLEQSDRQRLFPMPALPAPPPIFHGREKPLEGLIRAVTNSTAAHIAILGPGGIGKSSLAIHVLHHREVKIHYQENRFFIPCDSATSAESLISLIASHTGISDEFRKGNVQTGETEAAILAYFSGMANDTYSRPAAIVLDNLESPWEPDRSGVEKFLARLAAIKTVTLIITLRGVERPSNIQWDKPLFPPLRTLAPQSARDVFLDISDADFQQTYDEDNCDELDELLSLCDHLPLAIRLMAELAVPEMDTVPGLIQKWKRAARATTMLSAGVDANHSIELSIELSLNSPRMKRAPEAIILLGLLAQLPDGIREDDLARAVPGINNLDESQAALVKTSLAHIDRSSNRLKVLAPIRAYLTSSAKLKPRANLTESLRGYFWALIKKAGDGCYDEISIKRVLPELGNIENLIERALLEDFSPTLAVSTAARLGKFVLEASLGKPRLPLLENALKLSKQMQRKDLEADCLYTLASSKLRFFKIHLDTSTCCDDFQKASELYEQLGDHAGQGHCLVQMGAVLHGLRRFEDARDIILKANQLYLKAECLGGQASALLNLTRFHHLMNDTEKAIEYAHKSLELLRSRHHDPILEARCLQYLGVIHYTTLCNYIDAAELLEESQRIYKALQLEESTYCMDTTVAAGELSFIRSHFDDAKGAFHKAAAVYHKKHRRDYEANALINLGLACLGLEDSEEALEHINKGLAIWEEIPNKWGIGISYNALGDVDAKRGAMTDAKGCYAKALGCFRSDSSHWKSFEAECLLKTGILLVRSGQAAEARDCLQEALQIYDESACRRGKTNCLRHLAELDLKVVVGALKKEALARLESVKREYSEMGLYVESQQCALIISETYRSLGEPKQPIGLVLQI